MAHPKGVLIERLQKAGQDKPEFRSERTGPDHQPTFLCDVLVDGQVIGTGQGSNKREAERRAAEEALLALDAETDGDQVEAVEDEHDPAPARHAAPADEDDDFEGPWPMLEQVLAATVQVAEHRVADHLRGDDARTAVRDFALRLYKELLVDLGDVVEEEVDEEG